MPRSVIGLVDFDGTVSNDRCSFDGIPYTRMLIRQSTIPTRAWASASSNWIRTALDGMANALADGFLPSWLASVYTVPVELATNTNLFTGAQIVPRSETNLSPGLQYDTRTAPTARAIGNLMGASPRKVEHTLRGVLPGLPIKWGMQATDDKQAMIR